MAACGTCTCQGILEDCVLHALTQPLLATVSWQLDELGVGAVRARWPQLLTAQAQACHTSPQAVALHGAGWLEALPLLVAHTVELTAELLLT